MSLTELAFYIESVRLHLTPELHLRHDHAGHNPFLGLVPVRVCYFEQYRRFEPREKDGNLRYDVGKQIFINALSDFVPTDSKNTELLEKYAQGMWDVAQAYSALLCFKPLLPHRTPAKPFITQKHFYRNSEGDWKDLGFDSWCGTYIDEELEAMANKVK